MLRKQAIVSRHVVLYSARLPIYAVILLEGEVIKEIHPIPDEVSVTQTLDKYQAWNPLNCEHLCVSPGLIDVNMTANGNWEGISQASKAAVSGGVTLCMEMDGLYTPDTSNNTGKSLYCDVGRVVLLHADNIGNFSLDDIKGSYALKAYMSSPSFRIGGIELRIEDVFALAEAADIPLFLDPSRPDPRMLYMASPCRHLSLEARSLSSDFPSNSSFASAYPEELEPTSLTDSESVLSKSPKTIKSALNSPYLWDSCFSYKRNAISPCSSLHPDETTEFSYIKVPDFDRLRRRRNSMPRYRTIIEDLESRIETHMASIQELNKLEMLAYNQAGTTTYHAHRSISAESETDGIRPISRLKFRQNLHLSTLFPNAETESQDRRYLFYLANHPDHWESNGVMLILKAFLARESTCKVHFCNLSSADAVRKLSKRAKTGKITCETCPQYLFFSAGEVADGDTRFKTLPPIRSAGNGVLLWDLLKTNQIDLVSSHHVPVRPEYKFVDSGQWKKAVNGISSLGFTLQSLWTVLKKTTPADSVGHYLVRLAKWCSRAPARMLGIDSERGGIEEGKYADLVIWDPETLSKGMSYSKYPLMSPFQGQELYGEVRFVFVRGKLAYDRGVFFDVGSRQFKSLS